MCFFPDGGEGIGDHSNKKVDKPEVQDDDADNGKEAGKEGFRIDRQVHRGSELGNMSVIIKGQKIRAYTTLSRYDRNLECRIEEIVVTLDVIERIVPFLRRH